MALYKIRIGAFEYEVSDEDIKMIDISKLGQAQYHLIYQNLSLQGERVHISESDRTLELRVGESVYQCAIVSELEQMISGLNLTKGDAGKDQNLKAPMAGLILHVHVDPGQKVSKGDKLVTLEAMKMENIIRAQADAQVEDVLVKSGMKVDKGNVLLRLK